MKLLACECQKEYGDKLTYITMANSPAFWKTKSIANREYNKLERQDGKTQCSLVGKTFTIHDQKKVLCIHLMIYSST